MSGLRPFFSKVHLWVGLALGLVLVAISLTGSALVFRHEIDRALNPALLRVTPMGESVPLGTVVAAVREAVPESPPRLVRLPRTPESPVEVWLVDDRHVYVDPYRGVVLGVRGDQEGAMNMLFAMHAELLRGEAGERVVGVVGLLTLLLAATGAVLWWPVVPSGPRVRQALVVVWRRGPWRLNYDLHRAGGFYTSLFLVVVAGTGAALVFYAEAGAILSAATGAAALPPPPTTGAAALAPAVLDTALAAARRELPEAKPTFVTLPQAPGAPLAVRMQATGKWHPNGRSYVYLAPATGHVLRVDDAREAPSASRVLYAAYPLHVGALGGGGIRVLYALLGVTPAILSVTGTLIWFRRWRRRDRWTMSRPPGAPPRPPPPGT